MLHLLTQIFLLIFDDYEGHWYQLRIFMPYLAINTQYLTFFYFNTFVSQCLIFKNKNEPFLLETSKCRIFEPRDKLSVTNSLNRTFFYLNSKEQCF